MSKVTTFKFLNQKQMNNLEMLSKETGINVTNLLRIAVVEYMSKFEFMERL